MNIVLHAQLKKMSIVLKEGCYTPTIEFEIWQVINDLHWHF